MTLHNYRILCPTCFLYHDETVRERSLEHDCWWTVPKRVYHNSFFGTLALALMVEWHKRTGTWRRKVDRFIALTDFARQKFVRGGLPADRIVVKPNGMRFATPPATKAAGPRAGALFVGRLSEEKGVEVLIEAWKTVDSPLRIAGDGPLAEWIERHAPDHVQRLGRRTRQQIGEEMSKASFLVVASVWYEMFATVVIEAFASGLPVILSDIGGMTQMVEEGSTGLHFRVGDAADLAAKAKWATEHPRELEAMGLAARREYERLYTPETNYANLMAIYRDVLAERGLERHSLG